MYKQLGLQDAEAYHMLYSIAEIARYSFKKYFTY